MVAAVVGDAGPGRSGRMTATTSPDLTEMRLIVGEGILLAGGGRAILLQVANPAVGRAVAEHSDFAARPVDRLRATMSYVYGVTFGTPWEARRVCETVDAAHRGVSGRGYDARDPRLQLWVAATLYDTAVLVYERVFGPLPSRMAEAAYEQYALLGTALQVPGEMWPTDRVAFAAYWAESLATLEVTPEARSVADDVLRPRPVVMRALAPLNRLVTAGLLPASLRSAYGMPWDGGRQRRFDAVMDGLALVCPRLPTPVRQLPKSCYLRGLRRRLGTPPPSRPPPMAQPPHAAPGDPGSISRDHPVPGERDG